MDMNIVTPESVGLSSARLDRIGTATQGYVDQGRPPGLITAVARRGKVAHFECYGKRDVEAGEPMRPDTLLRIYSLTKPITAVALMMLLEEGRFLLDDPVSKYIPSFQDLKVYAGSTETGVQLADLERPITIRHLLTHAAGLIYGLWDQGAPPVEALYREAGLLSPLLVLQVPLSEMVRRLTELPLAYQPGADYKYSMAYDVIGYLVSVLADLRFDVYLQERVFQPLGMVDTGFYVPGSKLNRFAALYVGAKGGGVDLVDPPTAASPFASIDAHPSGGAGLVSTASDYLRFAQMLLNGGELGGTRLLGRKTVARMTMHHLPDGLPHKGWGDVPGAHYGLGFGVVTDLPRQPMLSSAGAYGWSGAAGARFWVDPGEELIGLSMPQLFWGWAWSEALNFQNLVYQAIVD
jgi:CubicO group peptidase (beta-lactamase class C family)